MPTNQDKLKEKYVAFRIKIKSMKTSPERTQLKKEMSDFLESVFLVFGQEVVDELIKKGK